MKREEEFRNCSLDMYVELINIIVNLTYNIIVNLINLYIGFFIMFIKIAIHSRVENFQ